MQSEGNRYMTDDIVRKIEEFGGKLDFLKPAERQAVLRNLKEINESKSPLYIGKRVLELRATLQAYRYFMKAIAVTGLVLRTAYAYMYGYSNAMELLPAGAVQAMMDRDLVVNINRGRGRLGGWTDAVALLPPPAKGTPETYARWVDQLIANKPKVPIGPVDRRLDSNDALAQTFRLVARMGKRLPAAERKDFAVRLIRYTMKHFDIKPVKFAPAEIPPDFMARRVMPLPRAI
jgi:hypothetical protein